MPCGGTFAGAAMTIQRPASGGGRQAGVARRSTGTHSFAQAVSASLRSCFQLSTLNSTLPLHFINSAASTSLKCFTVFTLSSMRNSEQK
eukprot:COSAG04_NODE_231_length_19199_cov_263.690209_22_plen_89_part_00